MPHHPQFDNFVGAAATELVGREDILSRLWKLIDAPLDGSPQAVFLTGEGGIGKTYILKDILDKRGEHPDVEIATEIIDLYHIQYHVIDGLVNAIGDAARELSLPNYVRVRQQLHDKRDSGEVVGVRTLREELLNALESDIHAATMHRRLVLILDTAERFVYDAHTTTQAAPHLADAWEWLTKTLPKWGNVLLLIAGRETESHTVAPLIASLEQESAINVHRMPVGAFSKQEALDYFDAAARRASERGNSEIAERIANLDREARLHAYRASDGAPIWLALLVDYMSVTWPPRLPAVLRESNTSLLSAVDKFAQQSAFEEDVISRLVQTEPFGDMLRLLGRATKGVDARLLSKFLDLPLAEAEPRLRKFTELSFVKVRDIDGRVFLHDEMYALLRRYVYNYPDDEAAQEKFDTTINEFQSELLDQNLEKINKLYRNIENSRRRRFVPELRDQLTELLDQRRDILIADVHYRLRQDTAQGFRYYYRYMRDAILSKNILLERELLAELVSFLAEKDQETGKRLDNLDGLERSVIDGMLLVQPVARAFAEEDYEKALEKAKLARELGQIILTTDPITKVMLDVREAYALIYVGEQEDQRHASEQLNEGISLLEHKIAQNEREGHRSDTWFWRARSVLAFAYRVRGYYRWTQDDAQAALTDYANAITLLRITNVQSERATALNDRGFILAQSGDWGTGRSQVEEALKIRHNLGDAARVALSLNTLALISTQRGISYQDGIENASDALALFRCLGNERGIGLALIVRAEAKRRLAGSRHAKKALLKEAQRDAEESVAIFSTTGETLRYIEAMIELGCNLRDQVRLLRQSSPQSRHVKDLTDKSRQVLEKAANLAGNTWLTRRIDALVNLTWLGYYAEDIDIFLHARKKLMEEIPESYWFDKVSAVPPIASTKPLTGIWPKLGKLNALYGNIAMDAVKGKKGNLWKEIDHTESDLIDAAIFYTLSLQYNSVDSHFKHRDLVRVEEEIRQGLTSPERGTELKVRQLQAFCRAVAEVERVYHFGESEMRKFLVARSLWYDPITSPGGVNGRPA